MDQMEFIKLSVFEFVDQMASREAVPGGGSAAALEGALGAALAVMVCCLTQGKERYAAHQELVGRAKERALDLTAAYLDLIDRDIQSFQLVSGAYRMPKGPARSAAIQEGLRSCVKPPLAMMELAVEALELTSSLLGRSSENVASDLGVAALALRSAIQSAWLNVLINVGSMEDQTLARDCREKGEALLARALPLADRIYETVAAGL